MKKIIVQRHGTCHSGWPKDWDNISDKEKETLGHLTSEGVKETRMITRKRLKNLEHVVPTAEFLLIYSPTYWLDESIFGQRAKETAEVIEEEIKKAGGNVVGNRLDFRLGEALFFQTPFADFLRKECGGQGGSFWEAFFLDVCQEARQSFGAEGPNDIAKRVKLALGNAVEWAHSSDNQCPKIMWVVTHGDCTIPYAMRLGANIEEIPDGYNQGFEINYFHDMVNAIVNGQIVCQYQL